MPTTDEIIEATAHYQPPQDNWLSLDRLVVHLLATDEPAKGMEALFGVFERFPEHDGYGVFSYILHVIESLPNYEPALVDSLQRQPTPFNVLMVNRILNAGKTSTGNVNGLTLLREVLVHPKATAEAKQDAEDYLEHQQTSHMLE